MKVRRWSKRLRLANLSWVVLAVLLSPWLSLSLGTTQVGPTTASADGKTPSQLTGGHWAFIDRDNIGYYDHSNNLVYQLYDDNLDQQYPQWTQTVKGDGVNNICHLKAYSDFDWPDYGNGTANRDPGGGNNDENYEQQVPSKASGLNTIEIDYGILNSTSHVCNDAGENDSNGSSYSATIGSLDKFNITYHFADHQNVLPIDNDSSRDYTDANQRVSFEGGTYEVYLNQSDGGTNHVCQDFMLVNLPRNSDEVKGYFEELDTSSGNVNTQYGSRFPTPETGCYVVSKGDFPHRAHVVIGGWLEAKDNTYTPPATSSSESCNVPGLGWIFCPFIDMAKAILYGDSANPDYSHPGGLAGVIVGVLNFGPLTSQYSGAQAVWSVFKSLADILFIVVFLVVIFSTTLSIGLSNYDIKKILPRLVTAAIFVQFSWVLMQLAFDITNIIAAGISSLITGALNTAHVQACAIVNNVGQGVCTQPQDVVSHVGLAIVGVIAAVAITIALIFPILMALLGLVLSLVAIFLTLEFRRLLLIILVVLSPLAFVAWILPGTENLFKTWWKMLFRLLVMYPLIVLIFAAAGMTQAITQGGTNTWTQLLAAALPIAAFFAIPWTFKWAGAAMNMTGSFFGRMTTGIGSPVNKGLQRRQSQRQSTKDLARRQKAAELYGKGRINRARARWMTGDIGDLRSLRHPFTASRASQIGADRLGEASKKAKREATEAAAARLAVAHGGLPFDQQQQKLREIAERTSDVYERQAAMERMLDMGMTGVDGLGGLAAKDLASGDFEKDDKAWKQLQSDRYKDIADKVGWLTGEGKTAAAKMDDWGKKVSIESLSTQKASSLNMVAATLPAGSAGRAALSTKATTILGDVRLSKGVAGSEQTALGLF